MSRRSSSIRICYNSYLAAFEDAEERIAQGEEQSHCPVCKRWFWADEVHQCTPVHTAASR